MIVSRGVPLFRRVLTQVNRKYFVQPVRNSGEAAYRAPPPPPPAVNLYVAEAIGAFMWWWILWHLWHEYEHVIGEFDYPDPSKWTDEELGIPSDDGGKIGLKKQK